MVSETDTDKYEPNPNEPDSTAFNNVSTSLVLMAVVAAIDRKSVV